MLAVKSNQLYLVEAIENFFYTASDRNFTKKAAVVRTRLRNLGDVIKLHFRQKHLNEPEI